MAKLTVIAVALLIALSALAEATTYTTTVTTITTDDESGISQGSRPECQQQIQTQQLKKCDTYISQENPGQKEPQKREQLQECCQQLSNIDSPCRCDAITEMVRRQSQQGQRQGQQMQQMLQKAENLPIDCNFKMAERCQIQPSWFQVKKSYG